MKILKELIFFLILFVNYCLKGSYVDNFSINCLGKNRNCFNDYQKPIYLLTYASWCVPGRGEIPALNELSKQFKDQINFIVLFWDKKDEVKRVAKEIPQLHRYFIC